MRSARFDVEQEEDEKEEHSLTRTTTTTRLTPTVWTHASIFRGQSVSKQFTGYSLYRELESDSIC
jgi:hypothetical protein